MKYLIEPPAHPDTAGTDLRIGIIVARYNWHITEALLSLAYEELLQLEVSPADIDVVTVPGAYELATISKSLLASSSYDALICFGCVMKGETRHDVLVGDAAAQGIQRVSLDTGVPIIFGVLCAENEQQAHARIDRGRECARSAVELAHIQRTLLARKNNTTVSALV